MPRSLAAPSADLVVRRVPEHGWGFFYKGTDRKAEGDDFGPWYATRKDALAAKPKVVASVERANFTLRDAYRRWAEGVTYTHEHSWADPSKFVGHVPADVHREAETVVLNEVPLLMRENEHLRAALVLACEDGWGDGEHVADLYIEKVRGGS